MSIVGAGAAGTLTALHLAAASRGRRGERLEILLVDPAEHVGRGVAYSTRDGRHLLNVPARGMSAFPDEPNHFVDWLWRHVDSRTPPGDFARRSDFAAYLDDTLRTVVVDTDGVTVGHRRTRATGLTVRDGKIDLTLADGSQPGVDAAVLAPGVFAPGTAWAPVALLGHGGFVADPWAPGALAAVPDDGDVLLVGTGLTGVDVALTLGRPGRTLHLVSRRGRLPAVHATGRDETPGAPLPELVSVARRSRPGDLEHLRRLVARTVRDAVRERRDWRAAFDTLRPLTGALWSSLSADDQARFLREHAAWWDLHRHRMAPGS
ncbi:MAG TPA: FAD/NAD(P)-binding protein, partial [Actinomycetes bacterium]|nr:FAD/NAD(P)-binding protein [Actinomycetes bacterium]